MSVATTTRLQSAGPLVLADDYPIVRWQALKDRGVDLAVEEEGAAVALLQFITHHQPFHCHVCVCVYVCMRVYMCVQQGLRF